MKEFEIWLLGRCIFGRCTEDVLAVLRRLFDFPEQARALVSDWEICVEQSDAAPPRLENPYSVQIHSGSLEVASSHNQVLIGQADAVAQLQLLDNGARIVLFGGAQPLYACLMAAMIEAMRASGLLPMHTAIAARDGLGLAFTGESGRGKTTTLLHSLKAGYQPVCEDFAWLEPSSQMVYGTDRGLRCLPDTWLRVQQMFPNAKASGFEVDKHLVPFEQLAVRVWACRLATIWSLERDLSQPTFLEALPKAQSVMALYGAFGVPLSAVARAQMSSLVRQLLEHLQIERLKIGNTPLPFRAGLLAGV